MSELKILSGIRTATGNLHDQLNDAGLPPVVLTIPERAGKNSHGPWPPGRLGQEFANIGIVGGVGLLRLASRETDTEEGGIRHLQLFAVSVYKGVEAIVKMTIAD